MTPDDLLKKWLGKRGAGERAEYQQFLTEFMQALEVASPGDPGFAVDDYRCEAPTVQRRRGLMAARAVRAHLAIATVA